MRSDFTVLLYGVLNDIAESKAIGIVEDARRFGVHPQTGQILFDILSQWIWVEVCREIGRRAAHPSLRSRNSISGVELRYVMRSLFDPEIDAAYKAWIGQEPINNETTRRLQFWHQLSLRHPDLSALPPDTSRVLAGLDGRWYRYCEWVGGVAKAEGESDRLRCYIWNSLAIAEQVAKTSDSKRGDHAKLVFLDERVGKK